MSDFLSGNVASEFFNINDAIKTGLGMGAGMAAAGTALNAITNSGLLRSKTPNGSSTIQAITDYTRNANSSAVSANASVNISSQLQAINSSLQTISSRIETTNALLQKIIDIQVGKEPIDYQKTIRRNNRLALLMSRTAMGRLTLASMAGMAGANIIQYENLTKGAIDAGVTSHREIMTKKLIDMIPMFGKLFSGFNILSNKILQTKSPFTNETNITITQVIPDRLKVIGETLIDIHDEIRNERKEINAFATVSIAYYKDVERYQRKVVKFFDDFKIFDKKNDSMNTRHVIFYNKILQSIGNIEKVSKAIDILFTPLKEFFVNSVNFFGAFKRYIENEDQYKFKVQNKFYDRTYEFYANALAYLKIIADANINKQVDVAALQNARLQNKKLINSQSVKNVERYEVSDNYNRNHSKDIESSNTNRLLKTLNERLEKNQSTKLTYARVEYDRSQDKETRLEAITKDINVKATNTLSSIADALRRGTTNSKAAIKFYNDQSDYTKRQDERMNILALTAPKILDQTISLKSTMLKFVTKIPNITTKLINSALKIMMTVGLGRLLYRTISPLIYGDQTPPRSGLFGYIHNIFGASSNTGALSATSDMVSAGIEKVKSSGVFKSISNYFTELWENTLWPGIKSWGSSMLKTGFKYMSVYNFGTTLIPRLVADLSKSTNGLGETGGSAIKTLFSRFLFGAKGDTRADLQIKDIVDGKEQMVANKNANIWGVRTAAGWNNRGGLLGMIFGSIRSIFDIFSSATHLDDLMERIVKKLSITSTIGKNLLWIGNKLVGGIFSGLKLFITNLPFITGMVKVIQFAFNMWKEKTFKDISPDKMPSLREQVTQFVGDSIKFVWNKVTDTIVWAFENIGPILWGAAKGFVNGILSIFGFGSDSENITEQVQEGLQNQRDQATADAKAAAERQQKETEKQSWLEATMGNITSLLSAGVDQIKKIYKMFNPETLGGGVGSIISSVYQIWDAVTGQNLSEKMQAENQLNAANMFKVLANAQKNNLLNGEKYEKYASILQQMKFDETTGMLRNGNEKIGDITLFSHALNILEEMGKNSSKDKNPYGFTEEQLKMLNNNTFGSFGFRATMGKWAQLAGGFEKTQAEATMELNNSNNLNDIAKTLKDKDGKSIIKHIDEGIWSIKENTDNEDVKQILSEYKTYKSGSHLFSTDWNKSENIQEEDVLARIDELNQIDKKINILLKRKNQEDKLLKYSNSITKLNSQIDSIDILRGDQNSIDNTIKYITTDLGIKESNFDNSNNYLDMFLHELHNNKIISSNERDELKKNYDGESNIKDYIKEYLTKVLIPKRNEKKKLLKEKISQLQDSKSVAQKEIDLLNNDLITIDPNANVHAAISTNEIITTLMEAQEHDPIGNFANSLLRNNDTRFLIDTNNQYSIDSILNEYRSNINFKNLEGKNLTAAALRDIIYDNFNNLNVVGFNGQLSNISSDLRSRLISSIFTIFNLNKDRSISKKEYENVANTVKNIITSLTYSGPAFYTGLRRVIGFDNDNSLFNKFKDVIDIKKNEGYNEFVKNYKEIELLKNSGVLDPDILFEKSFQQLFNKIFINNLENIESPAFISNLKEIINLYKKAGNIYGNQIKGITEYTFNGKYIPKNTGDKVKDIPIELKIKEKEDRYSELINFIKAVSGVGIKTDENGKLKITNFKSSDDSALYQDFINARSELGDNPLDALGGASTWQEYYNGQYKHYDGERSFAQYIVEAALKTGIDPELLSAIILQESNGVAKYGDNGQAYGLMQLWDIAQRDTHRLYKDSRKYDRFKSDRDNIMLGAYYLKGIKEIYGKQHNYDNWNQILTAYNAGPSKGRIQSSYAKNVLKNYGLHKFTDPNMPLDPNLMNYRNTLGGAIIPINNSTPGPNSIFSYRALKDMYDYDSYSIFVDKSKQELYLYKGSNLVKTYKTSTGLNPGNKLATGDKKTPNGLFHIMSIENSTDWKHNNARAYGPWFLRLDYTDFEKKHSIGIHGTNEPDKIGQMASEGCIRLRNEDIAELKSYMYKGVPVHINESFTPEYIGKMLSENIQKGVTSHQSAIGNFITLRDNGVDFMGLNPELRQRVINYAKDFKAQTGRNIQVNSAFRSPAKQKQLYEDWKAGKMPNTPSVARPGHSRHELGFAIDINSKDLDDDLLAKHGLTRKVVPGEPWHVEGIEWAKQPYSFFKNYHPSGDYSYDNGGPWGPDADTSKNSFNDVLNKFFTDADPNSLSYTSGFDKMFTILKAYNAKADYKSPQTGDNLLDVMGKPNFYDTARYFNPTNGLYEVGDSPFDLLLPMAKRIVNGIPKGHDNVFGVDIPTDIELEKLKTALISSSASKKSADDRRLDKLIDSLEALTTTITSKNSKDMKDVVGTMAAEFAKAIINQSNTTNNTVINSSNDSSVISTNSNGGVPSQSQLADQSIAFSNNCSLMALYS